MSLHEHVKDESRYSEEMLKQHNILLFGKITYELMVSFCPIKASVENIPNVTAEKIVSEDIVDEIEHLKKCLGKTLSF